MSEKKRKSTAEEWSTALNSEPEIFGRSKSREEIKQERKEQRARERAALREARKQKKAAGTVENKKDLLVMSAILLAVLIVIGVILGVQFAKGNKEAQYEMSEENAGYFYDGEAEPALDETGVSAAVNEVYYTKGGHLCVNMTLGNGTAENRRLDSLEVSIYNGKTNKLIAGGYTEDIDKEFIVNANSYAGYTFYISPEHVKINDDTLGTIMYKITAVATKVEE